MYIIFHDLKRCFFKEVNGVGWLAHHKLNQGIQRWRAEMGNQGSKVSEEEGEQCLSQTHFSIPCPFPTHHQPAGLESEGWPGILRGLRPKSRNREGRERRYGQGSWDGRRYKGVSIATHSGMEMT